MDEREKRYNEKCFTPFVIQAIEDMLRRPRNIARVRLEAETLLWDLDGIEYDAQRDDPSEVAPEVAIFDVRGMKIIVANGEIAKAASNLLIKDREVLLLSFFTDMRDNEIAKVLKVTRRTVINRRNAALRKLRELLEAKK